MHSIFWRNFLLVFFIVLINIFFFIVGVNTAASNISIVYQTSKQQESISNGNSFPYAANSDTPKVPQFIEWKDCGSDRYILSIMGNDLNFDIDAL